MACVCVSFDKLDVGKGFACIIINAYNNEMPVEDFTEISDLSYKVVRYIKIFFSNMYC